ncbi:hypothetical protein [Allokutzneria oryzae]|uniref:DUF3592 domain-containing protein n=1 Tax=Allokutzneria oryzae TaxID=1378989 RepID=A0ABV5ZSL2_9PSEU
MWLERWGVTGNLIIAVCQPLVLLGLLAGVEHLAVHGPDTGTATFYKVVLVVLVGVVWLLSIVLSAHPLPLFLGAVASMIAMGATVSGIESATIHERGLRTTCLVLDVAKRTETTSHFESTTNPDGTPGPGRWTTTTTTYYDHRLRCDDGPIDKMTRHSVAADEGQRLEIAYDPVGRVDPMPASEVTDGSGARDIALIALGMAVVLRVGGVLWERRHGW